MPIRVHDSITKLTSEDEGAVVLAASHGGVYCGYLTMKAHLLGVILNDAAVGLERAGIGSLDYLDALHVPAATVDYRSARIGDGADLERRGTISFANANARKLGVIDGEPARAAATKMLAAERSTATAPPYHEARFILREASGEPVVWGLDSISLVREDDAGTVIVSASHGGLLAGNPASALSASARIAAFNDAGIGIDEAGISRLPALQERGIAAVTIDAMSARIGDARSAWETGTISRWNQQAATLGAVAGQRLSAFVIAALSQRAVRRT